MERNAWQMSDCEYIPKSTTFDYDNARQFVALDLPAKTRSHMSRLVTFIFA